jgi:hypothetical protein
LSIAIDDPTLAVHNSHHPRSTSINWKGGSVYVHCVVDEFRTWAMRNGPERAGDENPPFASYFDNWMNTNGPIRATGGNRELFLLVFILASAWLVEKPDDWGEVGVRARLITDPGAYEEDGQFGLPSCLDPDAWPMYVFKAKYGNNQEA